MSDCKKTIPMENVISVSGIVMDTVKNKPLPFAKVYVLAQVQYGRGYYKFDKEVANFFSDKDGKFSFSFNNTSSDSLFAYALALGIVMNSPLYSDYYSSQENYVVDTDNPLSYFNSFNDKTNIVVKGRELNYTKLHLKVLSNPFDTLTLRFVANFDFHTVIGNSVDTTLILRTIPNHRNDFEYWIYSFKDTVGLGAGSYPRWRMLRDTLNIQLADTTYSNKTIVNTLSIPRN